MNFAGARNDASNPLADLAQVQQWAKDYIAAHPRPDFHIGPDDDHQLQRWFVLPRNPFAPRSEAATVTAAPSAAGVRFAPEGECGYCDRRREIEAQRIRAMREGLEAKKREGGAKGGGKKK